MSGKPQPKGWTCPKCKHWEQSPWVRICAGCGKARKLKKSKHQRLLEAARPQYQALLEAQGGVCAICYRAPSLQRKLDIDHDHRRLVVRGLLCHRCNRRLDSSVTSSWLRAAADYLDAAETLEGPQSALRATTAPASSVHRGQGPAFVPGDEASTPEAAPASSETGAA